MSEGVGHCNLKVRCKCKGVFGYSFLFLVYSFYFHLHGIAKTHILVWNWKGNMKWKVDLLLPITKIHVIPDLHSYYTSKLRVNYWKQKHWDIHSQFVVVVVTLDFEVKDWSGCFSSYQIHGSTSRSSKSDSNSSSSIRDISKTF